MSAKWSLFFDVQKCTGCRNCFVAVKDEYVGNARDGYFASQPANGQTWLSVEHHEQGPAPFTEVAYVLKTCQHCDVAPCMKAAKDGAVTKRADGIVVIDPQKARGQKQIADACPYGAVSWNENAQLAQAWPFDAHLFDEGWKKTRAEQVCPTGALVSEKLEDAAFAARKAEGWRALRPELNTAPRVLYKGLARVEAIFVAGSIEIDRHGVRDCLEGATVELVTDDKVVARAKTDAFGDFRFSGLAASGTAVVRIIADGCAPIEQAVDLGASASIGRRVMKA
jgi:Fe-S-cluster-containing dehydrogenase component